MAVFTTLAQGIYCVDALYIKPEVASIYILQQADEVAIIETGSFHSVPNVLATLMHLGIDKSQVKYVIPTHVHLDHAGGAGEMMRQFEQASLIVHRRGARHMIDPSRLVAATIAVYGEENFTRLYGRIEPIAEERVIIAKDFDQFELASRSLVFFDTQGHARHHFCIYDETSNGVFTGDSFGVSYQPMKSLTRGLIPSTPPTQFDPGALHESISRIMSFSPQKLYLTHYGEFLNPSAQAESFNRWIDDYVDLCGRTNPLTPDKDPLLLGQLTQLVLTGLGHVDEDTELAGVVANDLKLNAQGLAHWWRSRQHV